MNDIYNNIGTLRQIRHGEVVLYTNNNDSASEQILQNFIQSSGLRFTPKIIIVDLPELNHLIAVRRPVLTHPDVDAFAVARLSKRPSSLDIFHAAEFFISIMSNVTDETPREIEFINLDASDYDRNRQTDGSELTKIQCSKSINPENPCFSFSLCKNNVICDEADAFFDEDDNAVIKAKGFIPPVNEETEEEVEEEFVLDADRKAWLDALTALVLDYVSKYHSMPPMEKIQTIISGKLSLSETGISPITVNREMRIILPDYNEMELRMTPLARTIYILFLCHPEGILLKNIGDYRSELENIYLLVKPGASESNARKSIDELTIPGGDSLRQKLSMIKRAVNRHIINSSLAKNYYIEGLRGEPYKIAGVTENMIHLPAALMRC